MGIDVVSAARTRLKAYLDAEFAADVAPPVVLDRWPNANASLPERAVSLVVAEGAVPEVRYWPPAEFNLVLPADPTAATGTVQYSYGKFKLPLQLDVWAQHDAVRTQLAQRLQDLLHRHPYETLTPAPDSWPRLRRWPELALRETSLPGFVLYYRFPDLFVPQESGEAAQGEEYRLTLTGTVEGLLTTEEAVAILRNLSVTLNDETLFTLPGA